MIRLGLLDPKDLVPYAAIGENGEREPWLGEKHKSLVHQATLESIVLLKNSTGLLPLKAESIKSIVMVGALADRVLLDWYSGSLPYAITPIDGLRERFVGSPAQVHAVTGNDKSEAVRRARLADVAIVCVGNHPTGDAGWARVGRDSYGKEAVNRKSLELEDEALIKAVFAANPNTIVVLISSFPYAIEWTHENVPAILHMTHNSQEMGRALADVVFGDYNPGGRLVQSWPRSNDQLAPRLEYDIRCGHTYLYSEQAPLYPFGFGLSYTSFSYQNLRVGSALAKEGISIKIEVDVKNTGSRSGDDVVQLYVRHLESAVTRPIKELKGFRRVNLAAGETRSVSFELPISHLAYWNENGHCFAIEKGPIEIQIAHNSAEPELKAVAYVEGA